MSLFWRGLSPLRIYSGSDRVRAVFLGRSLIWGDVALGVIAAPPAVVTITVSPPVIKSMFPAVPAALTLTAPAPAVHGNAAKISAPPAVITLAARVPAVGIAAPPAVITLAAAAPIVRADSAVAAVAATTTVTAPAPAYAIGVPAAPATISTTALAPTVTASSTVTAVPATIATAAPAPLVATGVVAVPATVTIAAVAPVLSLGGSVTATAAAATMAAPAPAVTSSSTVTAPPAAVTLAAGPAVASSVAGSVVAAASAGANATPVTCNKPTGTASGDLMFAFQMTDFGAYTDMAAPAGWTLLTGLDRGSNLMHLKIWYKAAGGSEASTYAFPQSTGDVDGCTTIVTLRNVNTSSGTWLWATPAWTANSGTRTAPSVSGAGSGAVLLCHACVDMNNVASGGWTPPSGMTEQSDVQSRTWATQSVATLLGPANPSGTKAFTVSSNQNSGFGGIEWAVVIPAG